MNLENYCIPRRHRLLGQTTKQPVSNFDPPKPWKYKQLWGLTPDPSCLSIKKVYNKNVCKHHVPIYDGSDEYIDVDNYYYYYYYDK